jgi:hypothetical protein
MLSRKHGRDSGDASAFGSPRSPSASPPSPRPKRGKVVVNADEEKTADQWIREFPDAIVQYYRYIARLEDILPRALLPVLWIIVADYVCGHPTTFEALAKSLEGFKSIGTAHLAAEEDDYDPSPNADTLHRCEAVVCKWFTRLHIPASMSDVNDSVLTASVQVRAVDYYAEHGRPGFPRGITFGLFEEVRVKIVALSFQPIADRAVAHVAPLEDYEFQTTVVPTRPHLKPFTRSQIWPTSQVVPLEFSIIRRSTADSDTFEDESERLEYLREDVQRSWRDPDYFDPWVGVFDDQERWDIDLELEDKIGDVSDYVGCPFISGFTSHSTDPAELKLQYADRRGFEQFERIGRQQRLEGPRSLVARMILRLDNVHSSWAVAAPPPSFRS